MGETPKRTRPPTEPVRRQYTREYKLEAVRLASEPGRSVPQVARELGVRADMLRAWKRQVEGRPAAAPPDVFPGHGQLPREEAEVQRLRRENARLQQEVEFLKKAAAYFAKTAP